MGDGPGSAGFAMILNEEPPAPPRASDLRTAGDGEGHARIAEGGSKWRLIKLLRAISALSEVIPPPPEVCVSRILQPRTCVCRCVTSASPGEGGYSSEDQAEGAFQLPWQPAGIFSRGASLTRASAGGGVSSAQTSGVARAGGGALWQPEVPVTRTFGCPRGPLPRTGGQGEEGGEADQGCSRSVLQRRVCFGVQKRPQCKRRCVDGGSTVRCCGVACDFAQRIQGEG